MSYADDLRYARNPIARREPLDPKLAERWISEAAKIVRADQTFCKLVATGMVDNTRLQTSLRVRLRKSDNDFVLDGARRFASAEELAEAQLTLCRNVVAALEVNGLL